ncbi:FecR family protein [Flavobacterium hercynium]|uniref:Iron dicitrate transport regulator FecR n=1 Tax=Flavobacterium hercynium TaxID=387094 RepID=A0A226GPU6_9FLAO|nr:FecR family protein [Flavobacterium hercynium]OXA84089.1 iron dicitrate transport regulator FecR [Flavobacterium hercynium]SMP20821.1 FecR family protein [Flavobacterium hercynium]
MDKKKLDDEFEKLWNEEPVSLSDEIKEASWKKFQAQAFAGKKRKFKPWRYAAAASVLLFVLMGIGLYFNEEIPAQKVTLASTTIENTTAKTKYIVLPDSSEVALSPASKIVYGNNFALNRKIEITGEAYFKVTKDKEHPFEVFCNQTITTVLGTSFTVQGYDKNDVTVSLYEGSVQMSVQGLSQKWLLKPGQKFAYSDNVASVNEFNRFVDFDNEKITALGDYIEKNYGYSVQFPKEYQNRKITVRINKKEELETILKVISEIYNLDFEKNEELKQITFQ